MISNKDNNNNKKLNSFFVLLLSFALFFSIVFSSKLHSKEEKLTGKIIRQGLIEGFKPQAKPSGKPYTFEPSAVYKSKQQIVLINDRPLPDYFPSQAISFSTSLLSEEFINFDKMNPIEFHILNNSTKIEAATQSFNNEFKFASTSFSNYKKNQPKEDRYNRIVYWETGNTNSAKVINPSTRKNVISSMSVRHQLKQALTSKKYPNGPDYFKVEGLSFSPDNKLVFGIRSMGKSYKKSSYQYILIEAEIETNFNHLNEKTLNLHNFNKIYQMSDSEKSLYSNLISRPIGVSSIEFDKKRNGFFILTSFESDDEIGAYLWFYEKNKHPQLILNNKNEPLVFDHKAEGLLIMENGNLLIIHDDDREMKLVDTGNSTIKRKLNQGIYSIVGFEQ